MRKVAEYAKKDKAKIQFARISKFGLMELSRQKLKSSIIQNNYENCPTCDGTGQIKSLSSLAIAVLRIIEEEAINSKNKETVYLPVRLATYLLNEKKETIKNIESRHGVAIKIVPDPELDTSSYEIDNEGLEESEFKKKLKNNTKDYKRNNNSDTADGMIIQDKEVALMSAVKPKTIPPKPSVNGKIKNNEKTSIFAKIIKMIFGRNKEEDKLNKRPKRYYGKSRRYNKNFKYNKFKSNNKKSYTRNSRQKNN